MGQVGCVALQQWACDQGAGLQQMHRSVDMAHYAQVRLRILLWEVALQEEVMQVVEAVP